MASDDSPKPPISIDDLYGKSEDKGSSNIPSEDMPSHDQSANPVFSENPAVSFGKAEENERLDPEHIVYEETPVLTPVTEDQGAPPVAPPSVPSYRSPKPPGGNLFKTALVFVVIFAVGMGVSVLYRNLVLTLTGEDKTGGGANQTEEVSLREEEAVETDQTDKEAESENAAPEDKETEPSITSGWKAREIQGISYRLPEEMPDPVCDGARCPSRGAYLTGGTRFTVAFYDRKLNPDLLMRTTITDAAGREFETGEASVSGRPSLQFIGNFTGTTTGGYRFTRMRGFMILTPGGNTLEISHFTPAGITADFDSDETLFEEIVKTVEFE